MKKSESLVKAEEKIKEKFGESKPPIAEWLICWNEENPETIDPQDSIPFFFGYFERDGTFMLNIDDSCSEEFTPPKYWKRIF